MNFNNYFMNKSIGGNLKLNSQWEKSPPTHLVTLGCVENHLKDKDQPNSVCGM
jgi:hypothetical protein